MNRLELPLPLEHNQRVTKQESASFSFAYRHVGPRPSDITEMLQTLDCSTLDHLIDKTVPRSIRLERPLDIGEARSEDEVLEMVRGLAAQNEVFRSFIGMGYYDTITPAVIQRNILENPGWYTQYTPYQAEISQGRLEALLNFQTVVSDLTGLAISNASLLDEGTAAAEAMSLCYSAAGSADGNCFFVSDTCHPQTIDVVSTRAESLDIEIVVQDYRSVAWSEDFFGALVQYPDTGGEIHDYTEFAGQVHSRGALLVCAADLLSLTLLRPPGEWGADVAVGSAQRFGVPLGYGGPHAGFLAVREEFKRLIPGRVVGVSKDVSGRPALRLALQTREQHIRRDKATSNICTAQVLLAIMASMYAVYHGADGLREMASGIRGRTALLAAGLNQLGIEIRTTRFFDTLQIEAGNPEQIRLRGLQRRINLRYYPDASVGVSIDEATRDSDIEAILKVVSGQDTLPFELAELDAGEYELDIALNRETTYLAHPVFNQYRSETELFRYIHRLQRGDLSLTTSMIPLGSCTMKLNAAVAMLPITWPEWSRMHPFAPPDQAKGYAALIEDLEKMLCEITGLTAVSLQPNSGAQGEYTGLLAVTRYHLAQGHENRNVCLIPRSAHGTNPASAVMAGLKVVTVNCAENGDVDLVDLSQKAEKYRDNLSALMVTYPSTHGVFEEAIREICSIIHEHGGQVYMDGANMNALVGICRPGEFGVDVCHLNLHKTFSIPHGGGGPGVGPIAVASHLTPFLPGHFQLPGGITETGPVSSAPFGSAGILPISWAYMKLMGSGGLTRASQVAILNANYIATRLQDHFPVLYRGRNGTVAHECILDCRAFRKTAGVTVADIAKRLMDYGFHAPTVSWPVVETLMVEPTESESKQELDRFCSAMISIRKEIEEIDKGLAGPTDNVLKNAPHTAEMIASDSWAHPYSRQKAAFAAPWLRGNKFWTVCGRIDDTYGDRNLFCTCVPTEEYDEG